MPYQIIWEPHRAVVHFHGEASAIEAIQATQEWQADENFDELHHVIYDLRMAQSIETLDDGVIENIATMSIGASFSNPQIDIAVILSDNSPNPSIERIVALIADDYLGNVYPVRIFLVNVGACQ